jgi:nitroreductase
MIMNEAIQDVILRRVSCRSYKNIPLIPAHKNFLLGLLEQCKTGPFGTDIRFSLASASSEDEKALKGLGTYGFIKNPVAFIIGALKSGPKNLEDYGYLMERIVLSVTGTGIGTCWLGGAFRKSRFAEKISLLDSETVPAVVSAGYPDDRNNFRGGIRNALQYHRRLPGEQLFFAERFGNPLSSDMAGSYDRSLEMVRIAPSASNKQPWRIIKSGNAWHFFLRRTENYGKGTFLFNFLRLADLQRIDMGIAMCHFELTARSLQLDGSWILQDPGYDRPENTEYTATWSAR